jgi:hypothetical protein
VKLPFEFVVVLASDVPVDPSPVDPADQSVIVAPVTGGCPP